MEKKCEECKKFGFVSFVINVILAIGLFTIDYLLIYGGYSIGTTGYYCRDPKLSKKNKGHSISLNMLYVISFSLPLITIIGTEVLRRSSPKKLPRNIWKFYKDFLIGIAVTCFFTSSLKILVKEPRPTFFETCQPDANEYCSPGDWIDEYNCTSGKSAFALRTATESFPSGHASWTAFTSLYCAYVIQTRLPFQKAGLLVRSILVAACLTVAVFVSVSRVYENNHHWWDVLVGMIVGSLNFLYLLINSKQSLTSYKPLVKHCLQKEEEEEEGGGGGKIKSLVV